MAKYVAPSDLENLVELAISNSVKIEALLQLMVGNARDEATKISRINGSSLGRGLPNSSKARL